MINFFRKYWKYLVVSFILVFILVGNFFYEDNSVSTKDVKKLSVTKKEAKNEEIKSTDIKQNKTVFVDVNRDSKLVTPECIKNNYFK